MDMSISGISLHHVLYAVIFLSRNICLHPFPMRDYCGDALRGISDFVNANEGSPGCLNLSDL